MVIGYDPDIDAISVRFQAFEPGVVKDREEFLPFADAATGISVDWDTSGRIIGFEVLDASKVFPSEFLARLMSGGAD